MKALTNLNILLFFGLILTLSACQNLAGLDRSYADHLGLDFKTRTFQSPKSVLAPLSAGGSSNGGCKSCAN